MQFKMLPHFLRLVFERGFSKMAIVEKWSRTVTIEILFPLEQAVFFLKTYFRFLVSI
jgi:hypothetical protein